jgi:hypothetical protein
VAVILIAAGASQLSVAVAVPVVTVVEQFPVPSSLVWAVMFDGQVITGLCVSFTVTVKLQAGRLVFPLVSVAVQVTVVMPLGNTPDRLHVCVFPEAEQLGVNTTLPAVQTMFTPGQLSVATAVKLVSAEHWFGSLPLVMLVGQVLNVGFSVSLTVTEKEQLLGAEVFPLVSVATQLTFVTPLLKVEPEDTVPVVAPDAVQTNVTPGQLSAAVTVKGTAAVQEPGSVDLVMLEGQAENVGFSVSFTVTVKLHGFWLVFRLASVAVHVIVVVPFGKVAL